VHKLHGICLSICWMARRMTCSLNACHSPCHFRAHFVIHGLDEAERLTVGRPFTLRSSKWATYEVGISDQVSHRSQTWYRNDFLSGW
jgi:hypothetical protein